MAVIGATQLEPVNILGSYMQGMELGRVNRLAREQEMAARQQAEVNRQIQNALAGGVDIATPEGQRALMQFGPQGMEVAERGAKIGAERAKREQSLLEMDNIRKAQQKAQVDEVLKLVTAAKNPQAYGQIYAQAVERYGQDELNKLGLTPQFDERLLGTLENSLLTADQRISASLRAREARASEGRLAVDEMRARLEQRRVDLEDRRVALEEMKAQPGYQEIKIDQKTRAAREKAFPKASAAYRSASNDIDTLIRDLRDLAAHPGLPAITGGIEGRLPSVSKEATAAQAKLDKILAKGQFRSLQALRDASATGGAVGNVSDKEGQALRDSFGALSQTQQDEDFRDQIDAVIADLEFSKRNITQAYDEEYAYRGGESQPRGRRGDATQRRGSDASAIRSEADAILGL
jgi:hypothetical protein